MISQSTAQKLLAELVRMIDTFAPVNESDFKGQGLTNFVLARSAVAQAETENQIFNETEGRN